MSAPVKYPEKPQLLQTADRRIGNRPTHAKLTDEQVAEIRASEERGKDLAERYGVAEPTISLIRRNLRYRDPLFTPSHSRPGTSEQRGVHYYARGRGWRVQFRILGKVHQVGVFTWEREAIAAAQKFEREHGLLPGPEEAAQPDDGLSPEMRAWVARRKREIAGEPLTRADKEQLARAMDDVGGA